MKAPWSNRSGIPKAIAILATIALLSFGLCSTNMMFFSDSTGPVSTLLQIMAGVASMAAPLCLVAMLVLAIVSAVRR